MKEFPAFPGGPFEMPSPPNEHDPFDVYMRKVKDAGSREVITESNQYVNALSAAAQLIRMKEYGDYLPRLQGDFQGTIEIDGVEHYIDALIAARRAQRYEHWSSFKRREGIMLHRPAFFVHTFAVQDMLQDFYQRKIRSAADIHAYCVTATTGMETKGFFVAVTQEDRAHVQKIHNEIAALCSKGEQPVSSLNALEEVYQRYAQPLPSGMPPRHPVVWRGLITGHPFGEYPEEPHTPPDDFMEDVKPISWDERVDAFAECKNRARHDIVPPENEQAAIKTVYGFHGFLKDRRHGNQRFFHDEAVSAYPGGVFLYTRAVSADPAKRALSSRADIARYRTSIGLGEQEVSMTIHTTNRSRVNEIHLDLYERLIAAVSKNQRPNSREDINRIIKKVIKEYRENDAEKQVEIELT